MQGGVAGDLLQVEDEEEGQRREPGVDGPASRGWRTRSCGGGRGAAAASAAARAAPSQRNAARTRCRRRACRGSAGRRSRAVAPRSARRQARRGRARRGRRRGRRRVRACPRAGPSARRRATSAAVAIANGTLMMNTQRQDAWVTSQPPTSGPITNAMPVHAVHAPIAAPRSSPLKVAAITARPAGVSSAPAMPCRPRARIKVVPSGAAAQRIDVRPKLTIPIRNRRRAPKRSPSEPPTSNSEPSVSR